MTRKRFHILLRTLVAGDAVGTDALVMRDALASEGHEAYIYAEGVGPGVGGIRSAEELVKAAASGDTVIYHFSIGWDRGLEILRNVKARRIVKYHNVTPPEFFEPYSHELAELCMHGRSQIKDIARAGCELYLSDSGFNAKELMDEGVPPEKSRVVPPFSHIEDISGLHADIPTIERYLDGRTNILSVGRVAPNKGHKRLIEVFSHYNRSFNPLSRLMIVGVVDNRLHVYLDELRALVKSSGVEDSVVFTGKVSRERLKAFYLVSHAMLVTSYHEGFCVPLAEAMYFRLPVVALGRAAVPDTLGEEGLWWEEDDPDYLAVSLYEITRDQDLSEKLGDAQQKRYAKLFSNEAIKKNFLEAVL